MSALYASYSRFVSRQADRLAERFGEEIAILVMASVVFGILTLIVAMIQVFAPSIPDPNRFPGSISDQVEMGFAILVYGIVFADAILFAWWIAAVRRRTREIRIVGDSRSAKTHFTP